MIPLIVWIAQAPEKPIVFTVTRDEVQVDVLEVVKLGDRACDFRTRIHGPTVRRYDYIQVLPSIERRNGTWADLEPRKLDPAVGEFRWMASGEQADLDAWTGNIKLTITTLHLDPELIRREAIKAQPKALQAALLAGELRLKMTPHQVRLAWGEPKGINETVTASGKSEQWVYGLGTYVYFNKGVVTSWQAQR